MSSHVPHNRIYISSVHHPLLGCVFHQKSEIPYLSGYSIRRHRIGTDVILQKSSYLWDVKDLQTIVLLDLEANHTYKIIGRDEMQVDIEHIQIPPEQYRIPQRSSVEHGINRRLVFNY